MKIKIPILLAILLFLSTARVLACTCNDDSMVDIEFALSKTVVVLKAASYLGAPKTTDHGETVRGFKFTVQKVFKGKLKPGEELEVISVGMCSNSFYASDLGAEFLFYYFSDDNLGRRPFCSRSGPAKQLAADLSYLENMKKVQGLTRISGVVSQYFSTAVEGEKAAEGGPLKDHTVRITGNGRDIRLKTDENGVYEVYALPPGQYRIEPERIGGYRPTLGHGSIQKDSFTITVFAKGHSEADFYFGIDNAIRGRVVDADGKPLERIRLELLPARGAPRKYFNRAAFSEKDGSFKFEDVPAGTYVIAGNPEGRITEDNPVPRFYSPGSPDRAAAAEITIGPGQALDVFTVKAPRPADLVTVSGRLVFADGSPVRGEGVRFTAGQGEDGLPGDISAYTDNDGRFQLKLLKGRTGSILGYLAIDRWKYRHCSNRLASAVKLKPEKKIYLETPVTALDAAANSAGIELRFPFTLCE